MHRAGVLRSRWHPRGRIEVRAIIPLAATTDLWLEHSQFLLNRAAPSLIHSPRCYNPHLSDDVHRSKVAWESTAAGEVQAVRPFPVGIRIHRYCMVTAMN